MSLFDLYANRSPKSAPTRKTSNNQTNNTHASQQQIKHTNPTHLPPISPTKSHVVVTPFRSPSRVTSHSSPSSRPSLHDTKDGTGTGTTLTRVLNTSQSVPTLRGGPTHRSTSPTHNKLNPRLEALSKFKCKNPLCLHNHEKSLSMGKSATECMHQEAARMQLEGMHASDQLTQGLEMLQRLEVQFQQKKKQRARSKSILPNQSTSKSSADILPDRMAALTKLLAPPLLETAVSNNVIDAFQFDEYTTQEMKRARQIVVWQERSAKCFSVCDLPFLHQKGMPSPVAKRTPIEMQQLERVAQSRDASILALVFSYVPTHTLYSVLSRVCHLWRVLTCHEWSWSDRSFCVGDRCLTIEVPLPSTKHDGHLLPPKTLLTHIRKMPRYIREKLEGFVATTRHAQATQDLSEFKLDQLLLFPNLTRLSLELGSINGGFGMRQKSLNCNRTVEDIIVAKQLRMIRHFHLDSNPIHVPSSVLPSSTLQLVQSESRAATWLKQMIPFWEDCHTFDLPSTHPPIRSTLPSIIPPRPRTGILTIDLASVLFHGCWILRVLEKAACHSLETLTLSLTFVAPNATDKPIAPIGVANSSSSSSNRSVSPLQVGGDHNASTLGQQRLADLFGEVKVIPALFHTLAKSLKQLTLNLENDKVLAREKMTESTAFIVFMPILKQLNELRISNLGLADGGSVVPLAGSAPTGSPRPSPPLHSSLFQLPSWKHLQRLKRLDHQRQALEVEHAMGQRVQKPGLHDAFTSERDEEEMAERAARVARKAIIERQAALAERRKQREIERAAGLQTSSPTNIDEDDSDSDSVDVGPSSNSSQPIFTTLCLGDYKVCRCSTCSSKLHSSLSTFTFIMNSLSQLTYLRTIDLDDLSISDVALIETTTTTTTTTTIVNKDPVAQTQAAMTNGIQQRGGTKVAKQVYRRQVAAEFIVLTTTSTVTFSSCASFLLLSNLRSLTLPISCYEYDPSTNLVDSLCLLLGGRLHHLSVLIYGNGWPLLPDDGVIESSEQLSQPMPLIIRSSDQTKLLPYPRLGNLDKLSNLVTLSIRRDTHSLTGNDAMLPLEPLIRTLNIATSPSLASLTIDGFAMANEEIWSMMAKNLGGTPPPPPTSTPTPNSHSTSMNVADEMRDRNGSPTQLRSPSNAEQVDEQIMSARASLSELNMSRDKSTDSTRLVSPRPVPTQQAAKPTPAPSPPGPGLKSLSLLNYYGTLSGSHLLYLRQFPFLRHLAIGNTDINDKLNPHSDAAAAPPPPPPQPSSNHTPDTNTSSPTKPGVVTLAPTLTQPLSASQLTCLSNLLPQLSHLELIRQENLSNVVLRYWSETEPLSTSELTRSFERMSMSTSSTNNGKTILPILDCTRDNNNEASGDGMTQANTGDETNATSSSMTSPSTSAPTSPARPTVDARPSVIDVESAAPFSRLVSLTLRDCRPLGYAGLITLARSKLSQLSWFGLDQERKLMAPVQAAIQAGGRMQTALFQFHKGNIK